MEKTVHCKCKSGCNSRRCKCLKHNEPCDSKCKCQLCENPLNDIYISNLSIYPTRTVDEYTINETSLIDEQFLGRKLVSVREMVYDDDDDDDADVEGYSLNLDGYALEIRTMLDTDAIEIGCVYRCDPPLDVEPCYFYSDVSNDNMFSRFIGKRFLKWRLLTNDRNDWEDLLTTFDISAGLCFLSLNCSISVLTVEGTQFSEYD